MRFDRMAAVKYAWRYAISYNDNYPYFSYLGGDCTNFVSQVMHAGGWPMIPGARTGDPLAWWAHPHPGSSNDLGLINRKLSHTRTWTSVGDFYDHLESSKRCELCHRDELDLGDIVQMREFGAKHPHELSLKVGDGGNREGGISWGCLTPPLLHRRSDMPCPKITSSS